VTRADAQPSSVASPFHTTNSPLSRTDRLSSAKTALCALCESRNPCCKHRRAVVARSLPVSSLCRLRLDDDKRPPRRRPLPTSAAQRVQRHQRTQSSSSAAATTGVDPCGHYRHTAARRRCLHRPADGQGVQRRGEGVEDAARSSGSTSSPGFAFDATQQQSNLDTASRRGPRSHPRDPDQKQGPAVLADAAAKKCLSSRSTTDQRRAASCAHSSSWPPSRSARTSAACCRRRKERKVEHGRTRWSR
jgi:hypothetical protein